MRRESGIKGRDVRRLRSFWQKMIRQRDARWKNCQEKGTSRERKFKGKRCSYPEITLWLFNIAMGNGPFIDGLPIKNGDFPWLC
jgi:hypothetical protein